MRGVILREFLDMVDRHYGPETTEDISRAVGLTTAFFSDAAALPHVLRLAAALSQRSGTPVPAIMISFGEALFPRLAGAHPELLAVEDALKVLESVVVTTLAASRALDPNAAFPEFQFCETNPSVVTLECRSARPVADFAEGLIRGCLTYCRKQAEIRRTDLPGPPGHHARFEVALRVAQAA